MPGYGGACRKNLLNEKNRKWDGESWGAGYTVDRVLREGLLEEVTIMLGLEG